MPDILSSDWSMTAISPPALMQAIVRSPVVTLHSPVIVNRSHKNSFIILIFILAFCFVLLQVFKVVSYHYAFHVSHASLIPDTSCSKQRLTKTLLAPAHPG